jgi:hypothetical protein
MYAGALSGLIDAAVFIGVWAAIIYGVKQLISKMKKK